MPFRVESLIQALNSKDQTAQQEQLQNLRQSYERFADKNYAPEVDKKIAKVLLEEYRRQVPANAQPDYFSVIDSKYKGNVASFVDDLFAKSIYGSPENFQKFTQRPTAKALEQDPMILFASSVQKERDDLAEALKGFDNGYANAHRSYVKGLLEMYGDQANFPDANSSLRLTYGQVKGYSPRDAVYYECQTTLDGVIEKRTRTIGNLSYRKS